MRLYNSSRIVIDFKRSCRNNCASILKIIESIKNICKWIKVIDKFFKESLLYLKIKSTSLKFYKDDTPLMYPKIG